MLLWGAPHPHFSSISQNAEFKGGNFDWKSTQSQVSLLDFLSFVFLDTLEKRKNWKYPHTKITKRPLKNEQYSGALVATFLRTKNPPHGELKQLLPYSKRKPPNSTTYFSWKHKKCKLSKYFKKYLKCVFLIKCCLKLDLMLFFAVKYHIKNTRHLHFKIC